MNRVWAMPNKWTFSIKPISELLKKYSVGQGWIDPFCGESSPAEFKNDLNPDNKSAQHHMEALDFLNLKEWNIKGVVFDPPYSLTQVSRSYQGMGLKFKSKENPTGGFPKAKDRIMNIIPTSGIVISFGWNSIGMGKKRGFEIIEILLVSHGGNRNDTICTVEKKQSCGDALHKK